LRGAIFGNWNFDLSNTYGRNSFDYGVENSVNSSLRENSLTTFDAGDWRLAKILSTLI